MKLTQRDVGSSRGRLGVKLHITSVWNLCCSALGGAFHRHGNAAGACCTEGAGVIGGIGTQGGSRLSSWFGVAGLSTVL